MPLLFAYDIRHIFSWPGSFIFECSLFHKFVNSNLLAKQVKLSYITWVVDKSLKTFKLAMHDVSCVKSVFANVLQLC